MGNDARCIGRVFTPVSVDNGGTGHGSCPSAFDALSPCAKAGDIIFFDGTHNVRLEAGPPGWTLQMNASGDAPEWVKV